MPTDLRKTLAAKVLKVDLGLPRDFLSLMIKNRESVVYHNQNAKAIASENKKGEFSILPMHANFVTTIRNKVVVFSAGGRKEEIVIKSGILKVWANQVQIFLDAESPVEI